MNILTRRFILKSEGFGLVSIRDRDAPYHTHTVERSEIPNFNDLSQMTESQFDRVLSDLIYCT